MVVAAVLLEELLQITGLFFCPVDLVFVQLEKLNRERDRLEIEWGQLQLEQSAWSTHAFVENVAAQKLRMAIPQPAEIEVVAP